MINHVVCFKLKNYNRAACVHAQRLMLAMKEQVPSVLDVDVRLDQLHSDRSFDIMLTVLLKDWNALDEYKFDKYHCGVVKKFIYPLSDSMATLDFEV